MNSGRWFLCPTRRPDAAVRLFCLPFAGAGASMYRTWFSALPDDIEVRAVQLPGRESRLSEPRITDSAALARSIADAMLPHLDRPFALFGYSLGALLAFETVRELRRRAAAPPLGLFVAAMHAPQLPLPRPRLSHLPHDEFVTEVNRYYRPRDAAWQHPELLELFLPVLRDDMTLADGYACSAEPPLDCPIEAFAGSEDVSTPVGSVDAWRVQTTAEFRLTAFPGSHFFVHDHLSSLQASVGGRLVALAGRLREDA